jgi:hypothetical protein
MLQFSVSGVRLEGDCVVADDRQGATMFALGA